MKLHGVHAEIVTELCNSFAYGPVSFEANNAELTCKVQLLSKVSLTLFVSGTSGVSERTRAIGKDLEDKGPTKA